MAGLSCWAGLELFVYTAARHRLQLKPVIGRGIAVIIFNQIEQNKEIF